MSISNAPPSITEPLQGLNLSGLMGLVMKETPAQGADYEPSLDELAPLLPDFELKGKIGRGGMGVVFRAVQRKLEREVAIKILPVALGDTPGFADRFRREAMTTAGLSHPDIVAVYDTGETVAGHLFYVMEYVDGEDLAVRMARGRLSVEEIIPLLETICGAVAVAHDRGIVHRDIKPSNVLLTKDGRPRLADFGLALLTEQNLEHSRLTMGGTTLGTLEYAAPEQLAGDAVTAASDIYSLGVLAYELLTGELPRGVFDPPSFRNPEVDPGFDGVVLRAMQSDPSRRFANVREFQAALMQAADRRAQQERRAREARGKLRRRTRVAFLAVGLAAAMAGVAGYASLQTRRAERSEASAELTRSEAEKLVGFMLDELQWRLFEFNRLDTLEQTVAKVEEYYATVPKDAPQDDDFLRRKGDFLQLKGDLATRREQLAAALGHYTEAQRVRLELVQRHPRDWPYVNTFCTGQFKLGYALNGEGDLPGALAAHQQLMTVAAGYDDVTPEQSESQFVLMSLSHQAGFLRDHGHLEESQALTNQGTQRLEALLARPESYDDFALWGVKSVYLRAEETEALQQQDFERAVKAVREEETIFRRFLPQEAREQYRETMYGSAATRLGQRLLQAGHAAEAERPLAAACAIFRRMARDTTESASAKGQADTAAAKWTEARKAQSLTATPEALETACGLAMRALSSTVEVRLAAVERMFQEVLKDPESESAQYALTRASEVAGKEIERIEGGAAAVQHYERQLARMMPPLLAAAKGTWWNVSASATLNRIGEIHTQESDFAKAEPVFTRALELRQNLFLAHPDNVTAARNVASNAKHMAHTLVALQRSPEAASQLLPLLQAVKLCARDARTEWRSVMGNAAAETAEALEASAAAPLIAAAKEFLLALGPESELTAAEHAAWQRLQKLVP